jgi:hypothetical protein
MEGGLVRHKLGSPTKRAASVTTTAAVLNDVIGRAPEERTLLSLSIKHAIHASESRSRGRQRSCNPLLGLSPCAHALAYGCQPCYIGNRKNGKLSGEIVIWGPFARSSENPLLKLMITITDYYQLVENRTLHNASYSNEIRSHPSPTNFASQFYC